MKRTHSVICLLSLFVAACGDGATNTTPPDNSPIEVLGVWLDNFGSPPLTIAATKWGSQAIISFDNVLREAVTQNPSDAMFGPDKFSKQLWTKPDGTGWYTCTIAYGKDTAPAAASVASVAFVSAAEKNCGGFTWSHMTAK